MDRNSPYICCHCRLRELLYFSSGYSSIAWLTDCCVRSSNCPCRKLNTVLSVAFGTEVLAEIFGSRADHFVPSSVFELLKRVFVIKINLCKVGFSNSPGKHWNTGKSSCCQCFDRSFLQKCPVYDGRNKYRVDGLAAVVNCPARIRASLEADRRHSSVSVLWFSQPLGKKSIFKK